PGRRAGAGLGGENTSGQARSHRRGAAAVPLARGPPRPSAWSPISPTGARAFGPNQLRVVRFAMAPCHVCDSPRLEPVHAAPRPRGLVSSDVQAVEAPVTWAVCPRCGTTQKVIDGDWRRPAEGIYDRYRINHQASSAEPRPFN